MKSLQQLLVMSLICVIFSSAIAKSKQIVIFVSFSMADAALQDYYHEAKKLGAKLVMRGLRNNSFKDTQVKMQELRISVDIDPTLFEQYQVTAVPTIIWVNGQGNAKKITGNLTLSSSLEIMEKDNTHAEN
ncbi:MAG: hypothetical protein DMENIID0002_01620 [Rickettsia endosymbiont of Sergentomyia squamirostris]|uniref:Type-F conjugative transfer system pilin assembly protein TrbC n=1 Tax=Candidatus Tisiphia endosymbiont of Sergentomyia squamirostris TaxID=3113639 RepID=A0AAT9G6Q9_9RICK